MAFVRLIIIFMLAEAVSRPIITAKNATGRIRNYQIIVGGILLLMLPLSYIGFKLGMSVEVVPFCNALTAVLAVFARMYMLRGDFPEWSSRLFINKVLINVIIVSLVASILPLVSYIYIESEWLNFIVTSFLCVICTSLSILYIGCEKQERETILVKSKKVFRNISAKIFRKQ